MAAACSSVNARRPSHQRAATTDDGRTRQIGQVERCRAVEGTGRIECDDQRNALTGPRSFFFDRRTHRLGAGAHRREDRKNEQKEAKVTKEEAYQAFLRNYRRSPKANIAQAAIAENYEHLGKWVEAMDAYTNYINNYPEGSLATKAREQIAWIKTYRL